MIHVAVKVATGPFDFGRSGALASLTGLANEYQLSGSRPATRATELSRTHAHRVLHIWMLECLKLLGPIRPGMARIAEKTPSNRLSLTAETSNQEMSNNASI